MFSVIPILFQVLLAFSLGLKLFQDGHSIRQFIISLSFFVVSCPVGILIGIAVMTSLEQNILVQIVFILKALATGG